MANSIVILFIAVESDKLTLPIIDWMKDAKEILEQAYENIAESNLYSFIGRRGTQLDDILDLSNRYKMDNLRFLNDECTTLKGIELVLVIRSLTILIDKLISEVCCLKYTASARVSDREFMRLAYEKATVSDETNNWEEQKESGLFSFIKALILVMSDALANNKIFLYINYSRY